MVAYAIRNDKPIISKKPLPYNKPSKTQIEKMKFMDSHNFSFKIASSGEMKVDITEKQ